LPPGIVTIQPKGDRMREHTGRVYRSYQEFEREELRRYDMPDGAIEDLLDEMFLEELDFEAKGAKKREDDDEPSDD
jgi:hypothetical protein